MTLNRVRVKTGGKGQSWNAGPELFFVPVIFFTLTLCVYS